MINKVLIAAAGILTVAAPASAQKNNFKTTPHGLQYLIVKDVPGTRKVQAGDIVEMYISSHVGDSVLFNSRKANGYQPLSFPVPKPEFNGDMPEGIMMLTPGDSAVFRVPIDSIKTTGTQLPEFMQRQKFVEYNVVLVSVKTQQEEQAKVDAQLKKDDSILQDYFAKHNLKPAKTASGLYYIITTPGDGQQVTAEQTVTVNYTGRTLDGKIFDSNTDPGFRHADPLSFKPNEDGMIPGFSEGVKLLKKGGNATFFIPSPLAYGAVSPVESIPANGILIFEVELTNVE